MQTQKAWAPALQGLGSRGSERGLASSGQVLLRSRNTNPHPPRLQFNNWGVGVLFAQGDPRPPGQFQSLSEESVPSAV